MNQRFLAVPRGAWVVQEISSGSCAAFFFAPEASQRMPTVSERRESEQRVADASRARVKKLLLLYSCHVRGLADVRIAAGATGGGGKGGRGGRRGEGGGGRLFFFGKKERVLPLNPTRCSHPRTGPRTGERGPLRRHRGAAATTTTEEQQGRAATCNSVRGPSRCRHHYPLLMARRRRSAEGPPFGTSHGSLVFSSAAAPDGSGTARAE